MLDYLSVPNTSQGTPHHTLHLLVERSQYRYSSLLPCRILHRPCSGYTTWPCHARRVSRQSRESVLPRFRDILLDSYFGFPLQQFLPLCLDRPQGRHTPVNNHKRRHGRRLTPCGVVLRHGHPHLRCLRRLRYLLSPHPLFSVRSVCSTHRTLILVRSWVKPSAAFTNAPHC